MSNQPNNNTGEMLGQLLGAVLKELFSPNPTEVQEEVLTVRPGKHPIPTQHPIPQEPGTNACKYALLTYGKTPSSFSSDPPREDALQAAFASYNGNGLTIGETVLYVAVLRAMLIREAGVSAQTIDYTLDVALDIVDVYVDKITGQPRPAV